MEIADNAWTPGRTSQHGTPETRVLSIFTIPKPFQGHIGVIQRNAIRSWLLLQPGCEVILFGDEPGTDACAQQLGVRHIAGAKCNEYGTPRLDDIFEQAERIARFPLLCYVNADIILPDTFTGCVARVPFSKFLMVGQRVDVDITQEIDFQDPAERARAEDRIREAGVLHPPGGSDYFVFPRGTLGALPPFVVGRPGWDNWMISRATQLGVPVVDASGCSLVAHQNHDYQHVPGGIRGYEGPEADVNRNLVGGAARYLTPQHAEWRLSREGLTKQRWWAKDVDTAMEILAVAHPRVRRLNPGIRRVFRFRDGVRRRLVRTSPTLRSRSS